MHGKRWDANLAVNGHELTAFESPEILFSDRVSFIEDLEERRFISDVRFKT